MLTRKSSLFKQIILIVSLSALLFSCTKENDDNVIITDSGAQITGEEHREASHMKVYYFTYPSTDPWGNPVTLSGAITMDDNITTSDSAEGIMLYNHFTVYRADQCPSRGHLDEQALIVGSRLITISPDYYGFGATEAMPQAYCISRANAKASVDALVEGLKLLAEMGYKWKDNLFNAGYSQGGQTTLAIVREITEHHPEIQITRSFAGGGSYDLGATYHRFVAIDRSAMPSTVVSVMLAYNHFMQLNIPRDSMFIGPLLSHIDEWVLSKNYTRSEIDNMVGTNDLSAFISPSMMDTDTPLSLLMMEALESDNLCKGWTPRSDENILLVHHTQDGAVPVLNTENMAAFLQQNGVSNVEVIVDDFGSLMGLPAHESGALVFISATKEWISQYLGTTDW